MVSGSDAQQSRLDAFHVCPHCRSAYRREECSGRAITSGVYHCPKCGHDAPLNIEIREGEINEQAEDKPSGADLSS